MRIGIFAPYEPGETTQAACSLADLFRGLGYTVGYGTTPPIRHCIHHYWDQHACRVPKADLRDWAKRHDAVVWFDFNTHVMRAMVGYFGKSVLVLTRKMFDYAYKDLRTYLPMCEAVITPNEEVYNNVATKFRDVNLVSIPWHTGQRCLQQRSEAVADGELHLLLRVDGHESTQGGRHLLSALDVVLDQYESLFVTLDMTRRAHKSINARLRELSRDYLGRLRLVRLVNKDRRCEQYGHHDWTLCLGSHNVFGLDALESLAHGLPVAGFSHVPYTEIVQHQYSGMLTACDSVDEVQGLVGGNYSPASYLELLQGLCEEPERLDLLRSRDWAYMTNRYQAFRMGWKRLLDG